MYVKKDEKGNDALKYLYVDDLITIGSAYKLIEEIKIQLAQEFEMKYLGELYYCLQLDVWKDPSKTLITQRKYIREILKSFIMS